MAYSNSDSTTNGSYTVTAGFAERVRENQARLSSALKPQYDFIVCGSGSSGSVVAHRLAENPDVHVLLEPGGSDDAPEVRDAIQWPANYASDRNWSFLGQPSPCLNGRRMPLAIGKVLGGGSSINAARSSADLFVSKRACKLSPS
jgi:choline dehydrogenase